MNHALKMRRRHRVKARELKDVEATWVSLVERPANGIPFRMTKSEEPRKEPEKKPVKKSWLPKGLPKPFPQPKKSSKSETACNWSEPTRKAGNTKSFSITPNQVVDAFERLSDEQQIEALEKILNYHRKSVERKNFTRQEMGLRPEKPRFRRNS